MRHQETRFRKTSARQVSLFCESLALMWLVLSFQTSIFARTSTPVSQLSPSTIAQFEAAEAAQDRKDFSQAERDYRAVISAAPAFAPAYLNLGLIYQAQGQRAKAMKLLSTAASLDPRLFGAQFFLGVDECQQGRPQAATTYLNEALRLRPDYSAVYAWLATAQRMQGNLDGAADSLERGLRIRPGNLDMLYLFGRTYEALGRRAIDQLEKLYPRSAYVEQWLAEDYAQSGYSAAALIHFQHAMAISPDHRGLHLEVGELYLAAGNLGGALDEFNAELRIDPFSVAARVRREEAELLAGEIENALDDWKRAIAQDSSRVAQLLAPQRGSLSVGAENKLPSSLMPRLEAASARLAAFRGTAADAARAFIAIQEGHKTAFPAFQVGPSPAPCSTSILAEWLRKDQLRLVVHCWKIAVGSRLPPHNREGVARALFIEGHPDRALEVLRTSRVQPQPSAACFYWRARCYKLLAVTAYARLLNISPDSSRAHEVLGHLALAHHQDAKAIQEFRRALELDPSLPDLHYEIGHLLWKNFKVSEAREQFESELKLNPRHAGALLDMGATYLYEHQPAKALPFLRRAEKLDPSNPNTHEFLGTAYEQTGQYAIARDELEKAAASDKDGRVHYQLGKVDQALGDKKAAKEEFAVASRIDLASHRTNEERVSLLNAAHESLTKVPTAPGPRDADSLLQRAAGKLKLGQTEEAAKAARLLEGMSLTAGQFVRFGALLISMHRNSEALSLFEKLRRQNSGHGWAEFDLARADEATGNAGAAARRALALASHGGGWPAWSLAGIAEASLGDSQRSLQAFRRAAALDPHSEERWLDLTRELMGAERYEDAAAAAQEGILANPRSYVLRLRLGAAWMSAGHYRKAEDVFRDLEAHNDPLPDGAIGLAQVLLRTSRPNEAAQALIRAQRRLGDSFLLAYFLGIAYERAGDPAKATAAFRDAVRFNPRNPDVHRWLGDTELQVHDFPQAITQFTECLKLNPSDAEARRLLGRAYWLEHNPKAAEQLASEVKWNSLPKPEGSKTGDFFWPAWQMPVVTRR